MSPHEQHAEHVVESDALTNDEWEQIADAFVAANRAEFLDSTADGETNVHDPDLPILRAIVAIASAAWHKGYGAGSSDATDGWLQPGSPRTPNPYCVACSCGSPESYSLDPAEVLVHEYDGRPCHIGPRASA